MEMAAKHFLHQRIAFVLHSVVIYSYNFFVWTLFAARLTDDDDEQFFVIALAF
jgi:hypothetical protein